MRLRPMQMPATKSSRAKSGPGRKSPWEEVRCSAYLDSLGKSFTWADENGNRLRLRREIAKPDIREESGFRDDELLKLFGHFFFAYDSLAQKNPKNRFEHFLRGRRYLQGALRCSSTVGRGWRRYRQSWLRRFSFGWLRRGWDDLSQSFEVCCAKGSKCDAHSHARLGCNHFSACLNRSLRSIKGKSDGSIHGKWSKHFHVAGTERNIRDLHRQIHRTEFVDDGRLDSAGDARKGAT